MRRATLVDLRIGTIHLGERIGWSEKRLDTRPTVWDPRTGMYFDRIDGDLAPLKTALAQPIERKV